MTTAGRSFVLWSVALLVAALTALSFVLWGKNGAAYLVDLVDTYCF